MLGKVSALVFFGTYIVSNMQLHIYIHVRFVGVMNGTYTCLN